MTVSSLNNGNKTPIIISGTCATMSFSNSSYLGNEFVNVGSVSSPKGAVGFFGTTASGSGIAHFRGAVTEGFLRAIYEERTFVLGDAVKRGKYIMDSLYASQTRYQEWNLFGDPELNVWTEIPTRLTVIHNTVIYTPATKLFGFGVWQRCSSGKCSSLYNVCIMMDTLIYQYANTNSSGFATTCHNFLPYEKNVLIQPGNLSHDVGVLVIIEPQRIISVNTNVIPKVKVKNLGSYPDFFPVTFKIGTIYQQTVLSPVLHPQDTLTISFPNWSATASSYLVLTYTNLHNDQWQSNDNAMANISVLVVNDIRVDAILSSDSTQPMNIAVIPKARIKNYDSSPQTNFTVSCSIFSISGLLRYQSQRTVSALTSNETISVSFASWLPTISEQCLVKVVTNLIGDENPTKDELTKMIQISMLFVFEGFNGQFSLAGWQNMIVQGNYGWQGRISNNNPPCYPYDSSGMASFPAYSSTSSSIARLISPPIALGTMSIGCSLKSYMYHDQSFPGGGLGPDSVKIEYSSNGTRFNRVEAFRQYEPYNGWTEHSVYVGKLSGTIYLFSEYGNNINIDYIRLFSATAIEDEKDQHNTVTCQTINHTSAQTS